jgi:hypothetical protein
LRGSSRRCWRFRDEDFEDLLTWQYEHLTDSDRDELRQLRLDLIERQQKQQAA